VDERRRGKRERERERLEKLISCTNTHEEERRAHSIAPPEFHAFQYELE
jgi:hypothetical protein